MARGRTNSRRIFRCDDLTKSYTVTSSFTSSSHHCAAEPSTSGEGIMAADPRARAATSQVMAEAVEPRILLAIAPVGPETRVNESTLGNHATPSIAVDADGGSVVAWSGYAADDSDGSAIFLRLYDPAGSPKGSAVRVTAPGDTPQERPVVAMESDGDFIVLWHNELNGPIYARRYA